MTKEETRKNAEVMIAWSEGRSIEHWSDYLKKWIDCDNPVWNLQFNQYRIKPEPPKPVYRAWTSEEVPLGALVSRKESGADWKGLLTGYWNDAVYVSGHQEFSMREMHTIPNLKYSIDNGKSWHPCGVLVTLASTEGDE